MDRTLNKEILRLSLPSILANLTIPLVGFVDTAVAGHLPCTGGAQAATFIAAISVGTMIFNLLYWNFAFLRTGTGGLTAQAFGRGDYHACAAVFTRSMVFSAAVAILVLALQWPFARLGLLCVQASPQTENLALQYFSIRIWAAPATLSLMAFSGWFVGMQDSVSSMWKDLVVNGVNIAASIILSLGIGSWKGLGFAGVALGTVVAQYSGLLFCIVVTAVKYGRKVFSQYRIAELRETLLGGDLKAFFKMNFDLFMRSVYFIVIYIGYTLIASKFGDMNLACSSIMMQLLMIFSYFTDGFAYAGEALSGRFIGARDLTMLRRTVKYVFIWSMSIAVLFIGIYSAIGVPMLRLLTNDPAVVEACRQFLPWLALMPPLGCAAFTWDGIFLGATASKGIRRSMGGACVSFLALWFIGKWILSPADAAGIHLLLAAYFAHLLFRTVYLSLQYRPGVLQKLMTINNLRKSGYSK